MARAKIEREILAVLMESPFYTALMQHLDLLLYRSFPSARLRWLAFRTGDIPFFPRFLGRAKGHQFFWPYLFCPSTIRI